MARLFLSACIFWQVGLSAFGETIRVATYNVRNYLELDRWSEGHYRRNFPKPEIEKGALRRVLLSVRPDVLILQEMGPRPYLDELQSDLKEQGLNLPFAYLAEGSDKDRHLALLSRLDPYKIVTHTDLEFEYFEETIPVKRGMLEVLFQTQGLKWKVFGLHLKSKWSDFDEDPGSNDRRRSEVLASRKRILTLQKQDELPRQLLHRLQSRLAYIQPGVGDTNTLCQCAIQCSYLLL